MGPPAEPRQLAMSKVWLLALPLLLLSTIAHAADIAYVDLTRAVSECSDGKKAIAELQADTAARQKIKADHDKAKALAAPIPTDEQWTAEMQRREAEKTGPIVERMRRILPAIAKARKLGAIDDARRMVFVLPALDVTAELVKRYDAGEGRQEVAAGADLKAENAALKARLAALEKRKQAGLPNLDPHARSLTAQRPSP